MSPSVYEQCQPQLVHIHVRLPGLLTRDLSECGHYGKTQNNRKFAEEFRRRIRPSRKWGCRFMIYLARQESDPLFDEGDTWTIKYQRKPHTHNQDPVPIGTAAGKNQRKS